MKISIIGLGWFGLALAQELKMKHEIIGTTRSDEKLKNLKNIFPEVFILNTEMIPNKIILNADVIIINIPPFKGQLDWLKNWPIPKDKHIIFISSTSVYGQNQLIVNEEISPIPDSVGGKILVEEEEWIQSFSHYTIIRFGGLIGPDRHPGKYLSGRTDISGGNHPVNLIQQKDAVSFTIQVIEQKIYGEIFNLIHPSHPSRKNYYQNYCNLNNIPIPEFLESSESGKLVLSSKVEKIYQFKEPI